MPLSHSFLFTSIWTFPLGLLFWFQLSKPLCHSRSLLPSQTHSLPLQTLSPGLITRFLAFVLFLSSVLLLKPSFFFSPGPIPFFIKLHIFFSFSFLMSPLKRAFYSGQTKGLAMFSFTNVTAAWLKSCSRPECCTDTEQKPCSASDTAALFPIVPPPCLLNSNSLQWHFSKSHVLRSSSPCLQQKLIVIVHWREALKERH